MHPTGRAWNDLCRSMYVFATTEDMTVIAVVLKVRQSRNVSFKPTILPKKRTNEFVVFCLNNSTKNEFVRSFVGRIRGCQKVLSKLTDL